MPPGDLIIQREALAKLRHTSGHDDHEEVCAHKAQRELDAVKLHPQVKKSADPQDLHPWHDRTQVATEIHQCFRAAHQRDPDWWLQLC